MKLMTFPDKQPATTALYSAPGARLLNRLKTTPVRCLADSKQILDHFSEKGDCNA